MKRKKKKWVSIETDYDIIKYVCDKLISDQLIPMVIVWFHLKMQLQQIFDGNIWTPLHYLHHNVFCINFCSHPINVIVFNLPLSILMHSFSVALAFHFENIEFCVKIGFILTSSTNKHAYSTGKEQKSWKHFTFTC